MREIRSTAADIEGGICCFGAGEVSFLVQLEHVCTNNNDGMSTSTMLPTSHCAVAGAGSGVAAVWSVPVFAGTT